MTEKKNTCPLCGNHLEPAKAEIIIDLHEVTLLTSESYKAAFEGAYASVYNNKCEYRRLLDKVNGLSQRIREIMAKYTH